MKKSHKIILTLASISFVIGVTTTNVDSAQSHHHDKVQAKLQLKQELKEKEFELKAKANQANYKADTLKKQQAEEKKAEEARITAKKQAEEAKIAAEKQAKANAEEKLKQEENAKKAELEQEQQRINDQNQSQPTAETNTNQNITTNSADAAPTKESPVQPIARTDGFNFNGNHYDIGSFSGEGQVPASSLVYQWADYTAHLHILVERLSVPGGTIRQLAIGSKLTINGNTYTVFNERNGVVNNGDAYASLSNGNPAVTIQVCDSADPHSTLTIWYAS